MCVRWGWGWGWEWGVHLSCSYVQILRPMHCSAHASTHAHMHPCTVPPAHPPMHMCIHAPFRLPVHPCTYASTHAAVTWRSSDGATKLYDNGREVWSVVRAQVRGCIASRLLVREGVRRSQGAVSRVRGGHRARLRVCEMMTLPRALLSINNAACGGEAINVFFFSR
jgi:hypothetical protein